jgi:membrane fusion protein, adhesin transport system
MTAPLVAQGGFPRSRYCGCSAIPVKCRAISRPPDRHSQGGIENRRSQKGHGRRTQLTFHNTARRELNEAHAKLEGITASSVALMDRLERTAVRSPVRGIINQILVNTVGGIIQPGMDLIEIVPLEDSLLVEARIKPQDIAFLHPNQEAMIKFTAYDFTSYGGLEAELEHISADSITDNQGDDYYLVRLRTRQTYLGTEATPLPIIPGMVVSVDIMTGKKTILSYLLKPVLRARHTALRER